jgi:hypothetical protein
MRGSLIQADVIQDRKRTHDSGISVLLGSTMLSYRYGRPPPARFAVDASIGVVVG